MSKRDRFYLLSNDEFKADLSEDIETAFADAVTASCEARDLADTEAHLIL